jgi:phage shock protein PspC (stress-responsive transcriptional regulator)
MPSLVRFLVFCLILAALVGTAMYLLANFVEPSPRETTIRIPADRLQPE